MRAKQNKMKAIETLIGNYVNGNLTTAKEQSKRFSLQKLIDGLLEFGYGRSAAYDIANYLKGYGSFEAACFSEAAEKEGN